VTRSRTVDWVLVATFVPFWLFMLGRQIEREVRGDGNPIGVFAAGAASAADFPIVMADAQETEGIRGPGLRRGDRLLQIGGVDLRGASSFAFYADTRQALNALGPAPLELDRDGTHIASQWERPAFGLWWGTIPWQVATVLSAAILLLRARQWRSARPFFVGNVLFAAYFTNFPGFPSTHFDWGASLVCFAVGQPLAIYSFWRFTESALPLRPWQTGAFWALGATEALTMAVGTFSVSPLALPAFWTYFAVTSLSGPWHLFGLTRAYRRSDALERRQLRWVVLGAYLSLVPITVLFAGGVTVSIRTVVLVMSLSFPAMPLGIFIAVLGYRLFDIDRLLSATASYTLLGIAVLAGALALTPLVATAASATLGIAPATSQWIVSLGLAAVAVPVHRRFRPWLDRRMFAERVAVEAGLERLIRELSSCADPRELSRRAGEGIESLLRPESIASYAREESAFTPVFARGPAVPPAFEADGLLAKALATRVTPLSARDAELGAFDRAALETLSAEVVVPTRRGVELVSFTCLGRKRSGDIYTPAELALLSALASKSGDLLQRMSDTAVLTESRAMQESLRRYVPGAVTEQIDSGRELEARECEVTVLFVDVRGYTSFAESRPPQDVFSTLNEHTERVSRIVRERGGAVVEFNGDGMMAVFGAPQPLPEKERRAVEAAREIVEKLPEGLLVGVGVASGPAYAGNIRAADRWIWSVIGNTTNLAARLQGLTRELGASIAIDAVTQRAAGWVTSGFVRHADVPIRGRSARQEVWALPLPA
jgi:class 3 adenylate cyclase